MKPIHKFHPLNQQRYEFNIQQHSQQTFLYEEYGIKGVGRNKTPIVSMDQFRDTSRDDELHIECCKGLALTDEFSIPFFPGGMTPEELERLEGAESYELMLAHLEKYDPTGMHRKAVDELARSSDNPHLALIKYAYFGLGAHIPWFFQVFLKRARFVHKGQHQGDNTYTESSKHFPKLMEYIETLPFKEIGRIMFFCTFPNAGVTIHRDSNVAENKDHCINIFFGQWRPTFIWDEIKKEKIYLEKGVKSYFFNDRDFHGVDPESAFKYTLRVDGTFKDEVCEQLGMEDGYTWKWDYDK